MSVIPQSVAYKESGIPWVGKIPEHWEMRRVKYLFFISKEENTNENPNVLSLTQRGIIERDISTNQGQLAQSYLGYNIVEVGDIVFNPMDLLSGYVAKSQYNGVISQAYTKIRNKVPLDLGFYEKFFQNWYHLKTLWHLGKGVSHDHRWTLGDDVLLNLEIPLPPLQEQKAIADFLDKKTRQIEEFITKKQKLITLLEEKKQTLINQCVTQGLDPSTPLKDSGVEWLGKIPTHWRMIRLGIAYPNAGSGTTPKSDAKEYYDNGNIVWINSGDLNNSVLSDSEKKITNKALEDYPTLKMYPRDSIVVAMYGATIGKASILGVEACVNQACCVLPKSDFFEYSYVFYWFIGNKKNIIEMGVGGGQPNISQEIIRNLKISIPPLEEQKAIAEYLDTQIEKIDLAICKIKSQINLIKEYKTTLISEAVCGRVGID